MTRLETLKSLRDKVAALTGPDREVDALLSDFFDPLDQVRWPFAEGSYNAIKTPLATASRDAVAELTERLLPGRVKRIQEYPVGNFVAQINIVETGDQPWYLLPVNAPTEPLARLLALLDALIWKEEQK